MGYLPVQDVVRLHRVHAGPSRWRCIRKRAIRPRSSVSRGRRHCRRSTSCLFVYGTSRRGSRWVCTYARDARRRVYRPGADAEGELRADHRHRARVFVRCRRHHFVHDQRARVGFGTARRQRCRGQQQSGEHAQTAGRPQAAWQNKGHDARLERGHGVGDWWASEEQRKKRPYCLKGQFNKSSCCPVVDYTCMSSTFSITY